MLLHDHESLRVAILNACEGARTSRTDPFAGSAQSLVQQGIPAVIAMQFEIANDVAGRFAHEFYGALADGYPIDASLTEARKSIFAAGREVEWGTPVLYLRAPDGRIFDIDSSTPPTRSARLRPAESCRGPRPRRSGRVRERHRGRRACGVRRRAARRGDRDAAPLRSVGPGNRRGGSRADPRTRASSSRGTPRHQGKTRRASGGRHRAAGERHSIRGLGPCVRRAPARPHRQAGDRSRSANPQGARRSSGTRSRA